MTINNKPLLAACLVAFAWNAQAVEPAGRSADAPRAATETSPPVAWEAAPVQATRLARLRGGAAVSATVQQNGSVQGNTTTNVSAGANSVSGGSFANASGLPTVIQNSGANVVIQNSTVVNILFKP